MRSDYTHIRKTPWKFYNLLVTWLSLPAVWVIFLASQIPWGIGWRFYGLPVIQKHRQSRMVFGDRLQLRSTVCSNPLGANHAVILCTWQAGAVLEIGDDFGMTGGSICAAQRITIGDRVTVGANSTILDTDFHPLDPDQRRRDPQAARTAPVVIEDDVFIGMNSLILKGVRLGRGSVVGAGSVVTRDVPAGAIVAGNPARVVGQLISQET
jgi:acetyltransferase-like isoleucine patch superfamily enzyme